jgi:HAD superfamily hydrolase (TIGR01509 family)
MFDAVIFDCDGVLVDSEALGLDIELSMLAEIGMAYEREAYVARFMGGPVKWWLEQIAADYAKQHGGARLPDGFLAHLFETHRAAVEGDALLPVAGVADAVGVLTCAKAVASSSSTRGLGVKLRKTGLWALFDPHVYSTELVEHGKPAPDLFLHAAKGLGVVPARCLVIEDSINGVRAGRAAGMEVWGFTGGGHCGPGAGARLRDAGAHDVMASWADAAARFRAFG